MLVLHTFHGETLEMSENESAVLLPSRSYANIEEMGAVVISSRMKISHVASAHFFLLSLVTRDVTFCRFCDVTSGLSCDVTSGR